ncbi:cleavage and polyadenylation specificity factor subunit 2, partial [Lecanoromycetidae sp. Uapishka_2]
MFNFTPLLGAQSTSPASQSLLELDGGVKVLIDVGWDEHFDAAKLNDLERHVSTLSIILLTHATPAHIAAFAHCCKHFPSFTQIPIYATSPVISLGRTLLQDIYSSSPLASTIIPKSSLSDTTFSYTPSNDGDLPKILLQPPTSEEIATYFGLIHPLKYSQPHQPLPSPFSPPLNDLTITAYNAGHTLGGTIWRIQHGMESIVYAVDWNQARENVLSGAAWLGGSGGGGAEVIEELRKPTALVCSARGAEKNAMGGGRKKRDDLLLEMITTSVAKGGTVLIPTDTSARVLELAYILEQAWRKEISNNSSNSPLKRTKLYLASKNVGATMRYARSMLEWMDESVVRELESEPSNTGNRQNKRNQNKQMPNTDAAGQGSGKSNTPFDFKYLKLVEHGKRVEKLTLTKAPRVILASDTSLEWGFSKDILQRIASDPDNLIILTEDYGNASKSDDPSGGLGATLLNWYHDRRDGVAMETAQDGQLLEQVHTGGRDLQFINAQCVPLEGKELSIYQQYLASRRQSENFSRLGNGTALETSADAVEETSSTSSSSSEESDPERQGKALNTTAKTARFNRNKAELGKEVLGVSVLLRQPGVYDYDVRGKKGREQMFPFTNKRRRGDDFGDAIRPEDYLRAEERDDIEGQDMRDGDLRKQERSGQKRKWQESGLPAANGRQIDGPIKRRQQERPSNDDLIINGINYSIDVNGHAPADEVDSLGESEDEAEGGAVGPSKLLFKTQSVKVNLRIAFVDFAGLHDQRSLSNLIPLIQPKKLILVSGSPSETLRLADECKQKLRPEPVDDTGKAANSVFAPSIGQMIDASVDTNAWTVRLSEALVRRLHWQNVRGLGVVTLMGHLAATTLNGPPAEASSRKKLKLLNAEAEDTKIADIPTSSQKAPELAPTLDVLPPNMIAATRSVAQPLHVGDLRLADLRKVLQSSGHTAEFRGEGTLLIDGLVAVRKSGTGRIEVESGGLNMPDIRTRTLESSFQAVKRKIYDGLAVIAGG